MQIVHLNTILHTVTIVNTECIVKVSCARVLGLWREWVSLGFEVQKVLRSASPRSSISFYLKSVFSGT